VAPANPGVAVAAPAKTGAVVAPAEIGAVVAPCRDGAVVSAPGIAGEVVAPGTAGTVAAPGNTGIVVIQGNTGVVASPGSKDEVVLLGGKVTIGGAVMFGEEGPGPIVPGGKEPGSCVVVPLGTLVTLDGGVVVVTGKAVAPSESGTGVVVRLDELPTSSLRKFGTTVSTKSLYASSKPCRFAAGGFKSSAERSSADDIWKAE
jgi:hypothetical protein